MKIAVFSNLWPPVFVGGYEIGASKIVSELRKRGHEVLVIAAHDYHLFTAGGTYERGQSAGRPESLDAGLCLFGSVWKWVKRRHLLMLKDIAATLAARRRYCQALDNFQPDCLLAFSPRGILAPVLDDFAAYANTWGIPLHCYISDPWFADWPGTHPLWPKLASWERSSWGVVRATAWLVGSCLRSLGLLPETTPQVDHFFYCSDFMRRFSAARANVDAQHTVAPWGLADVRGRVALPPTHFQDGQPLTLLFAGQILEHKGLHILIQALARCAAKHRLVVIGDDQGEYPAECKRLAEELDLRERIDFLGKKKHEEMLKLLSETGHVLVVPSVWEEPFSIVVLEGMAVGLPVIASNTGGTAEILQDGQNGFLFPRNDFRALAAILDLLQGDRKLCRRVGDRARECILQHYTIERLVNQIEAGLKGASARVPKVAA